MKKIIAVLFLFTVLCCWVVNSQAQIQIKRPVWKVGYTWVIEESRDGRVVGRQTTRVTEADENGYIVETAYQPESGGEIIRGRVRYNPDLNIVKVVTLGVEGSQEFYSHDSKFFWDAVPGEKIVKYYSWADDRLRIRSNSVKVTFVMFQTDEDHLKISRVLTGRYDQRWETKDEIIFSLEKKWIEYRKVESGGHTNEARLVEFIEK